MVFHFLGLEEKEKEVVLILDTEFIQQCGKYSAVMRNDFMAKIVVPPVPLHSCKHLQEVLTEQVLFILFFLADFYEFRGFKPNTFKVIEKSILKLVTENERKDMFWGNNDERQPLNLDDCIDPVEEENGEVAEEKDYEPEDEMRDVFEAERIPIDDANEESDGVVPGILEEHERNYNENGIDQTRLQMIAEITPSLIDCVLKRKRDELDFKKGRRKAIAEKVRGAKEMKLPPPNILYRSLIKISETCKTNLMRMKFGCELLYAVFEEAEQQIIEEKLFENSSLGALLKNFIKDQLGLCVQPTNSLCGDGDIKPLFSSYPILLRYWSFGVKPYVVRAALYTLIHLNHMKEHCPHIILQLGMNAFQLNDGDIEHQNSCIARDSTEEKISTFKELRRISVNVAKRRSDINEQKELLEVDFD